LYTALIENTPKKLSPLFQTLDIAIVVYLNLLTDSTFVWIEC